MPRTALTRASNVILSDPATTFVEPGAADPTRTPALRPAPTHEPGYDPSLDPTPDQTPERSADSRLIYDPLAPEDALAPPVERAPTPAPAPKPGLRLYAMVGGVMLAGALVIGAIYLATKKPKRRRRRR